MLLMSLGVLALYLWHRGSDSFNLKDAFTAPGTDGIRRVDTSKTILMGTFLVSSYLLADNYSETALTIYLGAWVINGGAVLAYKAFSKVEPPPSVLK